MNYFEEDLFDADFDRAWSIAKLHGKFKGANKSGYRNSMPGAASFAVLDLYRLGKLSKDELDYLFKKTDIMPKKKVGA
jgi:hypothetical protein